MGGTKYEIFKLGGLNMTIEEAKKKIGKKYWKEFQKWMVGQTVSVYEDGSTNIYEYDVDRFLRYKKRGYPETCAEWD